MSPSGYDFKIGAPVLTAEGEVGRLKYVVVDLAMYWRLYPKGWRAMRMDRPRRP